MAAPEQLYDIKERIPESAELLKTFKTAAVVVKTVDDSIKVISDAILKQFLENIPDIMEQMCLKEFMIEHAYQGFNRDLIRRKAMVMLGSEAIVKIAGLVAMKGTSLKAIGSIKIPVRKTGKDGIVADAVLMEIKEVLTMSSIKGNKASELTPGRVCAAFPDLAVICMKLGSVQKKINSDLPAYLQFPAAGSLPMSSNLRALHKDFCVRFSAKINKLGDNKFSSDIYDSMQMNCGFTSDNIKEKFMEVLANETEFLPEYYDEDAEDDLNVVAE
jgi:hypothetical protein